MAGNALDDAFDVLAAAAGDVAWNADDEEKYGLTPAVLSRLRYIAERSVKTSARCQKSVTAHQTLAFDSDAEAPRLLSKWRGLSDGVSRPLARVKEA